MHIVFIVGSYYPNYSAVGKCVGNVADLLANKHKVTIICEKNSLDQMDIETYNNQDILRVITSDMTRRFKITDQIKREKGWKKRIFQLILRILRLQQVLKIILSKTSVKRDRVSVYIDALNSIDDKIDIMIPASMPFESVIAAQEYCKENNTFKIKLIPYLFDQFVDNESLHRIKINKLIKRNRHLKIEKDILVNSNSILIMKQLEKYFNKNYPEYEHLFHVVEHPLIVKQKKLSYNRDRDNIDKFIYAGSFYKGIREPEYLLKVFDLCLEKIDGRLELYTFGNCYRNINNYSQINDKIKNNGIIPSNKVIDIIGEADYLVAVGNTISNQVPSKIFEYLSFGKPIIYFYSNEDDLNIEVLKKYQYSLVIKQDFRNIEQNVLELIKFVNENKNNHISFEKVSKIYPDALPEYTASIIESFEKE